MNRVFVVIVLVSSAARSQSVVFECSTDDASYALLNVGGRAVLSSTRSHSKDAGPTFAPDGTMTLEGPIACQSSTWHFRAAGEDVDVQVKPECQAGETGINGRVIRKEPNKPPSVQSCRGGLIKPQEIHHKLELDCGNHLIRLDSPDQGGPSEHATYRAWRKPRAFTQKPDLALANGRLEFQGSYPCTGSVWRFRSKETEFSITHGLDCTEPEPPRDAIAELSIEKGDAFISRTFCKGADLSLLDYPEDIRAGFTCILDSKGAKAQVIPGRTLVLELSDGSSGKQTRMDHGVWHPATQTSAFRGAHGGYVFLQKRRLISIEKGGEVTQQDCLPGQG